MYVGKQRMSTPKHQSLFLENYESHKLFKHHRISLKLQSLNYSDILKFTLCSQSALMQITLHWAIAQFHFPKRGAFIGSETSENETWPN